MEREPVRVAQDVVLRASFAPVSGVGPISSPLFDRIDTPSIQPRDQSRSSASDSSSSTRWCSRSHTQASYHSRSHRHAVCPEPQPNCSGRSRQRQPVSSTTGSLPARPGRRSVVAHPAPEAGRRGISGSISSQSRPSTSRCCWIFATTKDPQRSPAEDHVATPRVLKPGPRRAFHSARPVAPRPHLQCGRTVSTSISSVFVVLPAVMGVPESVLPWLFQLVYCPLVSGRPMPVWASWCASVQPTKCRCWCGHR